MKQTRRWLLWGAFLTGLMGQVACSSDDDALPPVEPLMPVEVRLQVVAENPGAAMADGSRDVKADNLSTEPGMDYEYIHSLCVCVVNAEGKLEAKILPENLPGEAAVGNLKEYISESLKLTPGQKTLLAFANWETVNNSTWNSLIGMGLNEPVSMEEYDKLLIDNPAGKIDFDNRKFIPMSGKETVNVTKNTRSLRIGLDRLVAKVRVSVSPDYTTYADEDEITLTDFSISGFADVVPLFSSSTVSDGLKFDKKHTHTFGNDGLTLTKPQGNERPRTVAEFYVNATQRPSSGGGFDVEMHTRQFSGMTYKAVTTRTEVPRNSIYPLNVVLSNYRLDILPEAWRAPVGAEQRKYQVTDKGDYLVQMMDVTSKFRITPRSLNLGESAMQNVKWTWVYDKCTLDGNVASPDQTDTYPIQWNEAPASSILEGRFGANEMVRYYHFRLNAQWQHDSAMFNRTYNVIIQVVQDYMPFLPVQTAAGRSLCLPEALNLSAQ